MTSQVERSKRHVSTLGKAVTGCVVLLRPIKAFALKSRLHLPSCGFLVLFYFQLLSECVQRSVGG